MGDHSPEAQREAAIRDAAREDMEEAHRYHAHDFYRDCRLCRAELEAMRAVTEPEA